MKEYINIENCTTFEQMMLYIMSTMKEKELREDIKEYNWTPIGEIERYGRFGIDFYKANFVNELSTLDDNDPRWEIENQFQKVVVEAAKLYEMLNKNA